MGSKGIIYVKVEESTSYAIVKRDDYQYVECEKLGAPITAFIDDYCLDKGTVNPQSTLQSTKWIVIEEIVWDKLLAEHVKETGKQSFGDLEFFKSIPDRHILERCNGPKAKVNLANFSTPPTPGNIYLLMPYTHYPETMYKAQNLRLVYLKDPYIRYVYVDPPSQNEADIPFGYDKKLHLYGMYAHVHISTHLLPDFRKVGKFTGDEIVTDIHWDVFFVNDANEEVTVHEFSTRIENKTSAIGNTKESYNCYEEVKILIDPAWKDLKGVHQKDHQPQKYFIKAIGITQNVSYTLNPTHRYDLTTKPHKDIPPAHYNTYTDFQKWFKFNADEEMWLEMPMQAAIEVRWDTMEMIYKKFEIEKNNQIQYIGDVKYRVKEFDPCGYSKILIQEESNKDRSPFIVFDEDAPKDIDRTNEKFGVIAGDERKEISIILDKLTTKDVFCQGLLLDKGQKHTEKKNVFQIEKVYAAEKSKEGYPTKKDDTHEDQLRKAGISTTKENKTDYDVIKTDKSYNPSEVQHWTENIDYKFASDHKLTLMLNFFYNKTYENTFVKLLGYTADTINSIAYTNVQSTAWIVRYMFLKENYKQTYFVPISTCRYPNQIAKIEVYPDFEWWINVKYETNSPLYVKQAPNYKKRIFTTEENQNQRLSGARRSEQNKNWKLRNKKYELDFEAGYKINGQEYALIPGDGFPFLNAIRFFLKAYEIFKEISFSDEAEETEYNIGIGTARNSNGGEPERRMTQRWRQRKAKNLPFRIEISMPSFSGGIYGKFAQSKKIPSSIGSFYNLEFAAKPLFGIKGKLDLLYYAQFIGPIGQAMYRISEVVKKVNYLTLGAVRIDYFLYLTAKVDLNIELKAVEYHSIDGWNSGEVQVYAPINVSLESGVDVNVSIQGIGSADVGFAIKGEAKIEMRATYDKRENKSPASIKFNGLNAKIWVKFSAKSRTSGDQEDPENEPNFITSIIDPKDPWKIDIL